MEPDIMPLHPSSPPLLDDDGEEEKEVGSELDEFGDFTGRSAVVPCSPLGFADFIEPPLRLTQSSLATKPATPYYCFNHPVEQSQPASTVSSGSHMGQINMEEQDCNAEQSLHLTNGYAERDHTSGTHYSFSLMGTCSPMEKTGFGDFTVFTEQAAHPWCCGFTPIRSTEQWDGRVEGTNLVKQICDPGQEVIMDSEPKSHCADRANGKICTEVKHCDKRDTALEQPPQDHHHPQEAPAALGVQPADPNHWEEGEGKPRDSWRDSGHSPVCSSLQISEAQEDAESEEEKSISNVPQTFSVYESASEDLASFCDDLSFEGISADLDPNVSSLTSQENQSDWDKTDDEEEEQENCRHSDSFFTYSIATLRQTEKQKCSQSATQETPATSNICGVQSHLVANNEDEFLDFNDSHYEHYRDQEHVKTADVKVLCLGSLPPSDSFSDFCSAPKQEDGDGLWAEFKDHRAQQEAKTWTHFREQVSSLPTGGDTEQEQDWAEQYGAFGGNSCQPPLSCRIQQLLKASFPDRVVPAVDSEEKLLSLDTLLHTQHPPDSEKEEKPECSSAQWMKQGMWWPHEDIHSSLGLKFQWGDSHANRTLLRCLGVDTRNIGFVGMKKQPVAVPAFASDLGVQVPTKDSVLAVSSPRNTAVTAQTSPGPQDMKDPSTDLIQEALPSNQLDWSSHGLSSSQDGMSPRRAPHFWGRK
ncbi:Aftiphilin [Channa argus]|uniref:Aftiphilin n=1 Tax=Channa argus TaxID=215402 RepID=A0A6G1QZS7_CHAAH|nr:Aftiphilin [Channa argus]